MATPSVAVEKKLIDLKALSFYDAKIKAYINDKADLGFSVEVVSVLPTPSADYKNKILLVAVESPETKEHNYHNEYVAVNKGTEGQPNWQFELLGTTKVDLSGYLQENNVNTLELKFGVKDSAGAIATPKQTITFDPDNGKTGEKKSFNVGASDLGVDGLIKTIKVTDSIASTSTASITSTTLSGSVELALAKDDSVNGMKLVADTANSKVTLTYGTASQAEVEGLFK